MMNVLIYSGTSSVNGFKIDLVFSQKHSKTLLEYLLQVWTFKNQNDVVVTICITIQVLRLPADKLQDELQH